MPTYTPEQIADIILKSPDRITKDTRVPRWGAGPLISLRPSFFTNAGRTYRNAKDAIEELQSLGFTKEKIGLFAKALVITQFQLRMGTIANMAFQQKPGTIGVVNDINKDAETQEFLHAYGNAFGREMLLNLLRKLEAEKPDTFTPGPQTPEKAGPQTARPAV